MDNQMYCTRGNTNEYFPIIAVFQYAVTKPIPVVLLGTHIQTHICRTLWYPLYHTGGSTSKFPHRRVLLDQYAFSAT